MHFLRVRLLPCLAVLLAPLAAPIRLPADTIVLKDGKVIEGTIQEKAETYEVVTKYGALTIRKEDVARIVKDAGALKAEAEALRRVAISLAEEALKGEMPAEERGRKLSAAEDALQKALALCQDARSVSAADAAAALDLVVADLNRELARVREKRGAEVSPKPIILETPPAPPPVRPGAPPPALPSALSSLKPGLRADYFVGRDLNTPAVTCVDLNINFEWRGGPAWAGGPDDDFSARWSGFLSVPRTGRYAFEAMVDDGVVMILDGVKGMDHWQPATPTKHTFTAPLREGLHRFELKYFDAGGGATMQLSWSEGAGPAEIIAPRHFFHSPAGMPPSSKAIVVKAASAPPLKPGLQAEYFQGKDLKTLAVTRVDPNIAFNWGDGSAWQGGPPDNFSARWTGYLHVPRPGTYAFEIASDDGIEFFLGDMKILTNWQVTSVVSLRSGAVFLEDGYYPFKLVYFEQGGEALIQVSWKEGDGPFQVIAPGHFFHASVGGLPAAPAPGPLVAGQPPLAGPPAPPAPKAPEPGADAQKSAQALIRNIFKAEYARRTPDDQKALARRLLTEAEGTKDDPAARFVLFCESRDLAAAAGDPETAAAAVAGLAAGYAVDAFALKADALAAVGRSVRTPESAAALARCALAAADEALAADEYKPAAALAQTAASAAPRGRDPALLDHAQTRVREIADLQREFAAVQASVKKLAEAADDPEANLAVGRFRCLAKGAWDNGLPLLARGSDAALKEAATKDLQNPMEGPACMEIADLWWALAEKEPGRTPKAALRSRAGSWYAKAASQLTGLSRFKAEERLKRIGEPPGPQVAPTIQVLARAAFLQQMAARFPEKNNVAGSGKAKASSHYGTSDPQNALKGQRTGDNWMLAGPAGWFEAAWEPPVRGRRILLIGRTTSPGADSWGKAKVTVNGTAVVEVKEMSGSKVAVIDLGRTVLLRSIRIDFAGQMHPGLAGLEIHPQ
jgi:hypothetical protein